MSFITISFKQFIMMQRNSPVYKLLDVLSSDLRLIKLILMVVYGICTGGFIALVGQKIPEDFALQFKIMPAWSWALVFGFQTVARGIELFVHETPTNYLGCIVPTIGIYCWVTMVISNLLKVPPDTMSLTYLVPAMTEVLIISRVLLDFPIGASNKANNRSIY